MLALFPVQLEETFDNYRHPSGRADYSEQVNVYGFLIGYRRQQPKRPRKSGQTRCYRNTKTKVPNLKDEIGEYVDRST